MTIEEYFHIYKENGNYDLDRKSLNDEEIKVWVVFNFMINEILDERCPLYTHISQCGCEDCIDILTKVGSAIHPEIIKVRKEVIDLTYNCDCVKSQNEAIVQYAEKVIEPVETILNEFYLKVKNPTIN